MVRREYYASFDRRARLDPAEFGPPLGNADANVTLVEFSDFTCPFCRQLRPTLEAFVKARAGRVKLFYKPFPIEGHPGALEAAQAGEWARDAGIFWPMHDALFTAADHSRRRARRRWRARRAATRRDLRDALASQEATSRGCAPRRPRRARPACAGRRRSSSRGGRHARDFSEEALEHRSRTRRSGSGTTGGSGTRAVDAAPPRHRRARPGRPAVGRGRAAPSPIAPGGSRSCPPRATCSWRAARRAGGGAAPRPRCVLAGDLAGVPHRRLRRLRAPVAPLRRAHRRVGAGRSASVAFKDGEVRSARSTAPGERIGEIAVRLGFATEAQVAECLPAASPAGRALVERGVLSANDLWKCFHEQVTAVFHAILLSAEGTFHMLDEDVADRAGAPLAVSTQQLLMDGIRRIDELSLFRARIPSPQAYLRRREPKRPATLKPLEQTLLALVDGRRTVAEHRHRRAPERVRRDEDPLPPRRGGLPRGGRRRRPPRWSPGARLAAVAARLNGLLRLVAAAIPDPRVGPRSSPPPAPSSPTGQHALAPVWSRAARGGTAPSTRRPSSRT